MNRLTKMTHYISTIKTIRAENLAEILIREIVRIHDLSNSIITNRDSMFTVKYYFFLCYALKIRAKLSTVFHSQTDDQTKRQNSTMKQYLRAYVNFAQDD